MSRSEPTEVGVQIGAKIRKFREDRELTQPELAKLLDVAPSTISDWERGYTSPSIGRLAAVAKVLWVDVDDLVGAVR